MKEATNRIPEPKKQAPDLVFLLMDEAMLANRIRNLTERKRKVSKQIAIAQGAKDQGYVPFGKDSR